VIPKLSQQPRESQGGLLAQLVEPLPGIVQPPLRIDELTQAEDRLQSVVHLARPALDEGTELRVREKRPIDLQRGRPAE
jgi:hypothetical protein